MMSRAWGRYLGLSASFILLLGILLGGCALPTATTPLPTSLPSPVQAPPPSPTFQAKTGATLESDPYVVSPPDLDRKPSRYTIVARLDPDRALITGREQIQFTNSSRCPWPKVYFHLYPNAFSEESGAPYFGDPKREFPDGFNPGWLRIKPDPNAEVLPDKNTVLTYRLSQPLSPGESAEVSLEFEAKIPKAKNRYSYYEGVFAIGNWYPILAVFDENGWNLDPYYAMGDPFYSETALYEVQLTLPEGYLLAHTGIIMSRQPAEAGWVTYQIVTGLVRDFGFAASAQYLTKTAMVGDTLVESFYLPEDERGGQIALDTAVRAIDYFNKVYGQYPYRKFAVAETSFPGGMEYPNLIFIGKTIYAERNVTWGVTEYFVAHEVAHQWWYALVGNNQIAEPWLDEGLTQYSAQRYMIDRLGPDESNRLFTRGTGTSLAPDPQKEAGLMRRSVTSFDSWGAYQEVIYDRGAQALHRLRDKIGQDRFDALMQEFFRRYEYRVARVDDFLKVVEEVAGAQALEFLEPYAQEGESSWWQWLAWPAVKSPEECSTARPLVTATS